MIHERVIADLGPAGLDYNEPALAMTRRKQLGAAQCSQSAPFLDRPVRAMLGTNQSGSWTAQPLLSSAPPNYAGVDVAVAVIDPAADAFVLFAMNSPFGSGGSIRYRTWTASTGFSLDWVVAYDAVVSGVGNDKPWVIRRAPGDFLLFLWTGGEYRYLRTNDGGDWRAPGGGLLPAWTVGTTAPDPPVTAWFCCHPSVAQDGRVFLAHVTAQTGPPPGGMNGKVRVLLGHDPEGDTQGELTFESMNGAEGGPLEFEPRVSGNLDLPVLCPNGGVKSSMVPTIACDPTDSGRAYIVYHDIAPDDPSDVNVYLARLTRLFTEGPEAWTMTLSTVVAEPPSVLGVRGDQFCPVLAVDPRGWVHVLYYDNRPAFEGVEGCPADGWGPADDAYYALSTDQGQTFSIHNLRTNCEATPALDLGLQGAGIPLAFGPREYNGIALYESGNSIRVWVLYTGTTDDPSDDSMHRSVIYGQQIVVTVP